MKKILALLALVLGVVSCQTEPEGLDVNVGGDAVDTTICVSLPEVTRANSALGAFDNVDLTGDLTIRYILKIYQHTMVNGEETWTPSTDLQVRYTQDKNETIVFPVRLVPNRDYNFVVWADLVNKTNEQVDDYYSADNDIHYNTSDLANITLKGDWNAMDETRDAYTGFYNTVAKGKQYTSTSSINITLTRPFAKLRVVTTDMEALRNLAIAPEGVTVRYNVPVYNSFNALDGVANTSTIEQHTFTYNLDEVCQYEDAQTSNNLTLFADYLFGADNGIVKFYMDVVDTNDTRIKENNFSTDIHVQRNYLTTIQGNILTDGNNVTVTVEENGAFANDDNTTGEPYYYQTISSEAELLAAIENGGEYIVVSNIDVTGLVASTQAATRTTGTTTPATTTINLNGYTITLKDEIEVKVGNTLIITDINENGEVGAIVSENGGKIINNGTLNIEGGSFGENTIVNNDKVNITGGTISQGAITGDANITGGEFTYNPENEIPDGYKVVETENGKYEVRVGDPIAQIGNETYTTLQAAFDAAEGETTIVLLSDATFKNTSVLANGKTVVLNLNGKTLAHTDEANQYALSNLGTLTITGNGTVNSRGIYNGYVNGGENVATAKLTIENGSFNAKGTNGGAAVYNYGTVDVKGGAFTSIGGYSLNNQSGASMTIADGVTANNGMYATGATVTINGGEISGNRSGCHVIYAYNSTVTINGGTLYNNNSGNSTVMAAGSTKITYNGGTYGIKDGRVPGNGNTWTSCLLDSNNSAEVVVNDGTYNGGFRVQAGTSMTINGGSFNDCYGSNYNIYGTVTVKGGTYTDDAAFAFAEKYIEEGYVLDGNKVVKDVKVAKVGSTEYRNIDEAIAAWTNNTTLTLLNDVELSDVITLKSTEHHILDLGTYKMTAASGKDAFVIKACGTGDAERNAITIKADATNPGSINAGNKCIVYYKYADGGISGNDRPIIKIEGGIFNASTSSWGTAGIYVIGSAARKAATINISGGTFNCSINGSSKSKLLISGGIFNYSVGSQGDVTALRLISGGKFKTLGFMTSGYNDNGEAKFWIGTSMKNSDVGVYVNDEGYLVVGGPVITEFGDKFAAKATNPTKWSSYLQYSSAADNGLYYTNADVAIKKHGEANVVLK